MVKTDEFENQEDTNVDEHKFKEMIIENLDNLFDRVYNVHQNNDCSDRELEQIESIFMSCRNIIAGFEWDGNIREYEKYQIRKW